MKKISLKALSFFLSIIIVLSVFNIASFALQSGNFTYSLSGDKAKITGVVNASVSGTLEIPSKINGYSVTSIGAYALAKCDSITTLVIPSSVTTLDANAISDCDKLETVSISTGLKSIGRGPFYGSDKLTEITVSSSSPYYTSVDGILFTKDKTTLVYFPASKTVENYTVPSTVDTLAAYAFADNKALDSITLPSSVKTLGTGVFSESDISEITLSSNITSIPERAFYNCSDLTKINLPSAIKTINAYAFFGCDLLTSVTLPSSLTTIKASAFNGCSSLKTISISSSNTSYCSIDGILYSKATTSLMIYPNGRTDKYFTVPSHVLTIAQNAFGYSENLVNVTVPTSVTKINPYAFIECKNLDIIKISNKSTTFGTGVFDGCDDLTISCMKDSTAYSYAKANNISCSVSTYTPVTSVKLNASSLTWASGRSGSFKPTVSPSNATDTALTWKSSNTSVATVSSAGILTTIKPGTATITCTSKDNASLKATCKVTVVQGVTSVKLNASTIKWPVGKAGSFKPTVSPSNAHNQTLSWTSSNPAVATVSSSGKLTAVSVGTTTITCSSSDGTNKTAKCTVTVTEKMVTSVTLNVSSLTWPVGKAGSFKPTVSPSDAYNQTLSWTSSNPAVATVSSTGKLTAVSKGTTTITCSSTDGSNKTAKCTVTVTEKMVTSVTLNVSSLTWPVGKAGSFKPTVSPSDAYNQTLSWTSSNPAVATVSSTGKLTAVSKGTTTITCKATDGSGKYATCKVTVK